MLKHIMITNTKRKTILEELMKKALLMFAATAMMMTPALAADTYTIDPVHSHIQFKIMHLNTGYQYGRFNDFEGTVVVDEKTPANSKVDITVKTASVDTKVEKRDEHLRSADFFNAAQFPNLTFKSTKVEGAGANKFKVSGNLTMHGVTKPLSFVFTKTGQGPGMQKEYRMGGEASFTVNRHDFGIDYMKGGLGKDVTVMLSFEGIKK